MSLKMNKKGKITILILVIVLVILISSVIWQFSNKNNNKGKNTIENNEVVEEFVEVQEDGTKVNISTKLHEIKIVEGLEVGNIRLKERNGMSVILADVVNKSGKRTEVTKVKLTLIDKEGNTIEELEGLIDALEPEAVTQLNMAVGDDHANAYDFTIIKDKS